MGTVEATRQRHFQNPQEFSDQLFNYWKQLWTRDPNNEKITFQFSENDSFLRFCNPFVMTSKFFCPQVSMASLLLS